jgi:hypothetical protein
VPLLETTIALLANQAANYLIGGSVPEPMGNHHPNIAPYGAYACADGAMMIGAGNDAQFRRLCAVLGRDDLADDPRFADNASRVGHAVQLTRALEEALAAEPAAHWQAELERQGVPVAPVNTVDQVFADAHVREVGLVAEVDHPTGPLPLVRSPVTLSATPAALGLPPPCSASTPRPCWPSSATPGTGSPACSSAGRDAATLSRDGAAPPSRDGAARLAPLRGRRPPDRGLQPIPPGTCSWGEGRSGGPAPWQRNGGGLPVASSANPRLA